MRALLKLAVLWGVPWTLGGLALGIYRWVTTAHLPGEAGSLVAWLASHALAFGALGLISGLDVGLLLAHAERGRRVEQITSGRLVLWAAIGGLGPPLLFGLLGFLFGAPSAVYLPLAVLGVVSAAVSGAVMRSALGAGRRHALPPEDAVSNLEAT